MDYRLLKILEEETAREKAKKKKKPIFKLRKEKSVMYYSGWHKTQAKKIILIDGGPASGKTTLGKLLVENFNSQGEKSILLDLDSYVEEFCPKWVWDNNKQKEMDLFNARENFIKAINKYLQKNSAVIAIGERFLIGEDVNRYMCKLAPGSSVYLYHLSVPIMVRGARLEQRGHHTVIDLDKDQRERDKIEHWLGYVYQNINFPAFANTK